MRVIAVSLSQAVILWRQVAPHQEICAAALRLKGATATS